MEPSARPHRLPSDVDAPSSRPPENGPPEGVPGAEDTEVRDGPGDPTVIRRKVQNAEVADVLERVADLLEARLHTAKGADAWRVRGWRGGAATVRELDRSVAAILEERGVKGLVELPAIGRSLSAAIQEYVESGRLDLLVRLEGEVTPRALFTTVPGIGEDLARRIHETLGIETLEDLEIASHDGRLAKVPGFGSRRVRGVREALDGILGRAAGRRARGARARAETGERPSVATLLAVDREYRDAARAGELDRVAPRRFNPEHEAWLPVLSTERDGWTFSLAFSNSARAHELGTTDDWVVIHAEKATAETHVTVVTEHRGPLEGRRVVRGREAECRTHYAAEKADEA